jgi:hypothetical protein
LKLDWHDERIAILRNIKSFQDVSLIEADFLAVGLLRQKQEKNDPRNHD